MPPMLLTSARSGRVQRPPPVDGDDDADGEEGIWRGTLQARALAPTIYPAALELLMYRVFVWLFS